MINPHRREFPTAVACLEDDVDGLRNVHRVPVRHRAYVRTTNLAENSFGEGHRVTKVIPHLLDEESAMKLVFATRSAARETCARIASSDRERHQYPLRHFRNLASIRDRPGTRTPTEETIAA